MNINFLAILGILMVVFINLVLFNSADSSVTTLTLLPSGYLIAVYWAMWKENKELMATVQRLNDSLNSKGRSKRGDA